tara:strand:- start:211 stop:660 length:450 start_codon:yes stop_codon:yes gene_type:complete
MNANDWRRYGDLEFEDGIDEARFLVDVSELLWGDATCPDCEDVYNCNCENRREPYTTEESIERLRDFNEKSFAWEQEEKENQIKELKMLVVMMHGDGELGDYWQDMANDLLSEDEEREELQNERERNEDETGISETDDEREEREEGEEE